MTKAINNRVLIGLIAAIATAILTASASRAQSMPIAIIGVKIHTMGPAGTIEKGAVLISDGRIAAVGADLDVFANARIIDASGKTVTPGMFDPYSQIGVVEIGQVRETVDGVQSNERYTASFEVADAINPRSTLIPINRIEGVTRAMVAPVADAYSGVSGPISGLGSIIHLGSTEGFLVSRNAALFVSLGEEGAELSEGARGNTLLQLREALEDARDFGRNRASFDSGNRREYSLSRTDLEALQPVLAGQRPMVARVHRASDIEIALALADEFGIKLIVAGGSEAWMVADRLNASRVPVVLNPFDNLPTSFDKLGSTLENAARLHQAGVVIAFSTDETHNARNMKQLAGNAVANGLPYEVALAAITINPARIYGLTGSVGSIETGKAADVVVWDGDPLELSTFAERVFIAGKEIPMVSRATLLRDRYLELNGEMPPAYAN
jgi:imidazolonepropionase-like amidohydrolase